MIADYLDSLTTYGAAFYRNLFWEPDGGPGAVSRGRGSSIRATGIGCYFDDAVHEVSASIRASGRVCTTLTVGGPVEDGRLTTTPAYA